MHDNILQIIKSELCCGCGVCAGICPFDALSMQLNAAGEYCPKIDDEKCTHCGLCMEVCPFSSKGPEPDTWQTASKKNNNLGRYENTFVGYSSCDEQRLKGASGGVATWTAQTLLQQNKIDALICVTAVNNEPFRQFSICKTKEEIQSAATSSYYPVEASQCIKYIKNNPGQYAITALPCLAKGLRKAQLKFPWLNERLKYIFGLTCGGQRSTFFVKYLAKEAGIASDAIRSIKFRVKDSQRPASDYGLTIEAVSGESKTIFWAQGMDKVWTNKLFMLNSCQFCNDVFAEYCDVSFMDAWLPEYFSDYRGHSMWIVRNSELLFLYDDADGLLTKNLPSDSVEKSQAGVISFKKTMLPHRTLAAKILHKPYPAFLQAGRIKKIAHVLQSILVLKRTDCSRAFSSGQLDEKEYSHIIKKIERFETILRIWTVMKKRILNLVN